MIDIAASTPRGRPTQDEAATLPVARLGIPEPSIALDLALAGAGIATVPLLYAGDALRAGQLVHVLPGFDCGVRTLWATHPQARWTNPKVSAFVRFAREAMADRPGGEGR